VEKNHPRVEAYGDVDELNTCLGLLIANMPAEDEIIGEIEAIQSLLFHVGARLSVSAASPLVETLRQVGEEDVRGLEGAIDRMEEGLPPLKEFILPGGHPAAAIAHVSRAVCRRAERRVAALLAEEKGVADTTLIYLNRLSDYLFVLARHINRSMGVSETLWKRR